MVILPTSALPYQPLANLPDKPFEYAHPETRIRKFPKDATTHNPHLNALAQPLNRNQNKMDQNTNGAATTPLQGYLQTIEGLDSSSFGNEEERLQALHATYALVSRIESPWEMIVRLGMGQVRNAFGFNIQSY